jgi:hypothetical protein
MRAQVVWNSFSRAHLWRHNHAKPFVIVSFFMTILLHHACGLVSATPQPDVKPEYQKFFRYYKPGRSFPSNVLQAHGINDDKVGRSYAVIAGVSTYPNLPPDKQTLEPAKNDVENLVRVLRDKQYFDEIIVIENDDVSLATFNYFLQVYLPKQMAANPNARFLFAYSGHGFDDDAGSGYILTRGATSMQDLANAIDLVQLKVAIEKVVAKALDSLILINSCQGGSFLEKVPFGGARLILATPGAHAITAGAKGQFTYGSGAQHHGSYFFDEVMAGLSGGADFDGGGLITADQLYSFVRTEVQKDTNADQDPQFGDIAPHTSRGSLFFVDPSPNPASAKVPVVDLHESVNVLGNASEPSCAFALFSDYYGYALKNGLQDDLLRLVDSENWQLLQEGAADRSSTFFSEGRAFLGGAYPLTDDYVTFDQKRSAHFKDIFYNRSLQQATDIMQLTVGDRTYASFGDCLSRKAAGPILRAWASRESLAEIELHVMYFGRAGSPAIDVNGSLIGGYVADAPKGKWYPNAMRLRPNEERVITIHRNEGDNEVHLEFTAGGTSSPLALTYRRADGILSTLFTGTSEVLREANHRIELHTPDNNENRGGCPNEVGHHDGKYCTSRTTLTMSTAGHRILKNARVECSGLGCPWTKSGLPVYSSDGTSVSVWLDNWGSDVDAILIADEYERLTTKDCGSTGSVPAVYDRPVLFAVPKDCVPFAVVRWVTLPSFSEGIAPYGTGGTQGQIVLNGPPIQGDSAVIASYSLKANKPSSERAPGLPLTELSPENDLQIKYLNTEISARIDAAITKLERVSRSDWIDGSANTGVSVALAFAGQYLSSVIYPLDHSEGTISSYKGASFTELLLDLNNVAPQVNAKRVNTAIADYKQLRTYCDGLPSYEEVQRRMTREQVSRAVSELNQMLLALRNHTTSEA